MFVMNLLVMAGLSAPVLSQVTLYPEVATNLPSFPFTDNDKLCFNKYYERQTEITKQARLKWNCPEKTCETNLWCCMSFKIVGKIKELEGKLAECQVGWFSQSYVNKAINTLLDGFANDCEEPYVYGADVCDKMEQSLGNKTNRQKTTPRTAAAVEVKENDQYCSSDRKSVV